MLMREPYLSTPAVSHRHLWYAYRVRMRVLFAISILAFATLLWACIAMLQHVRKVRTARQLHRKKMASNDLAKQP